MVRNILFILKMLKSIELLNTTQMQVYRQSFSEYLLITSRVTVSDCGVAYHYSFLKNISNVAQITV